MRTSIAICLVAVCSLTVTARELTFEERVRAQEAIERVYYAHQVDTTVPFETAVPRNVLETKVRNYLSKSVALQAGASS